MMYNTIYYCKLIRGAKRDNFSDKKDGRVELTILANKKKCVTARARGSSVFIIYCFCFGTREN